jgi:hypothetical protein
MLNPTSPVTVNLTGTPGVDGVDGAGYDFPFIDDPESPLTQPLTPSFPTPHSDGRVEWAYSPTWIYNIYGKVGAYKVGDYVRLGDTRYPGSYMFGTIGEITGAGTSEEAMTIAIQESSGPSFSIFNETRTVSLAVRSNPGYSFPLQPVNFLRPPTPAPMNPIWPNFDIYETWEYIANELEWFGSVGDYKVGDYVRMYDLTHAPGAYLLGYVLQVYNRNLEGERLIISVTGNVGDYEDFYGSFNSDTRRVALEPIPGPAGNNGVDGVDGVDGPGVPIGGTAGQILTKVDGTDFNTTWSDIIDGGTA